MQCPGDRTQPFYHDHCLLVVATLQYYVDQSPTISICTQNISIGARGLKTTRALAANFETTHRGHDLSSNKLARRRNRMLHGRCIQMGVHVHNNIVIAISIPPHTSVFSNLLRGEV